MHACSVVSGSLQRHGLAAHQAPISTEFSRQQYWSGLPFPPPGKFPDPGIKSMICTVVKYCHLIAYVFNCGYSSHYHTLQWVYHSVISACISTPALHISGLSQVTFSNINDVQNSNQALLICINICHHLTQLGFP